MGIALKLKASGFSGGGSGTGGDSSLSAPDISQTGLSTKIWHKVGTVAVYTTDGSDPKNSATAVSVEMSPSGTGYGCVIVPPSSDIDSNGQCTVRAYVLRGEEESPSNPGVQVTVRQKVTDVDGNYTLTGQWSRYQNGTLRVEGMPGMCLWRDVPVPEGTTRVVGKASMWDATTGGVTDPNNTAPYLVCVQLNGGETIVLGRYNAYARQKTGTGTGNNRATYGVVDQPLAEGTTHIWLSQPSPSWQGTPEDYCDAKEIYFSV